jgi:hypothetical protein
MRRNAYTKDEIALCTYAARFDVHDIGGIEAIRSLSGRSEASIQMKIQNIAAMLDEAGIARESDVSALTGVPADQSGRRTNWDWVEPLASISKAQLLSTCKRITNEVKRS